MKILIACEESQTVTKEFRAKGHEAYSCDLESCSGGHPEWHIKGDVTDVLWQKWDMIIAFPPCNHLARSGARWFRQKKEDGRQQKGIDFFMLFVGLKCPLVAIENSVGIMSTEYRKPDQIIHPHQFGHDASKQTCLWLKGLPLLTHTLNIEPRIINGLPRWGNQTNSGQNRLGPSLERAKLRSKTYPGIAKAMAEQWG